MIRHCLKLIALGLILFPEPVSTAVGIIMLTIILALPGYKKLSKFKNLEELARRSLRTPQCTNSEHWTSPKKQVVHHELKGQVEPTLLLNQAVCSTSSWFDNRSVNGNVLYHTLKNSIPQYEAGSTMFKTAGHGVISPDINRVVPAHTLKIDNLRLPEARIKSTASDRWIRHFYTPDEIVLHTLKTNN